MEVQTARPIQEIEQLAATVQALYSDFYDRSFSVLQFLRMTSQNLRCSNGKKQCLHANSPLCPIQLFGSARIFKPEKELLVFEGIKGKIRQFQAELRQLKKETKNSEKQVIKLRNNETSLTEILKSHNNPVLYYNLVERLKQKKVLAEKFAEYLSKKKALEAQLPTHDRLTIRTGHLYDWFNGELEDGFTKAIRAYNKLGESSLGGIRQYFFYVMDWCLKQIQKLQKSLNRANGFNLDTKWQQGQSAQLARDKCLRSCKFVIKHASVSIRQSDLMMEEIKTTLDSLNAIRRQLQKQATQVDYLKTKIHEICADVGFFRSHKLALSTLLAFLDLIQASFSRILEGLLCSRKLQTHRCYIVDNMKRLVVKQTIKSTPDFYQFKTCFNAQVAQLERVQAEINKIRGSVLLTETTKFFETVRQIDLDLSSSQKQFSQDEPPAISDIRVFQEESRLGIKHNQALERQVRQVLEEVSTMDGIQKENIEKVYSCALKGNILLAGKLRLYRDGLCFESVFNDKNLFFGTTILSIPSSQITGITKEAEVLVQNTIKISTKKGPVVFTSLFDRDKTYEQISSTLFGGSKSPSTDQPPVQNIKQEALKPQPRQVEPTLTVQQLADIEKKSLTFDRSFTQPYSIGLFQLTLPRLTLQQVYRQLYSEKKETHFKKKTYGSFKQLILMNSGNSELTIGPLSPNPPSFFEPSSKTRLSQVMSSARTLKYKHEIGSVPIPFMPRFGNCTEQQTFHWISNKTLVIDSQTVTVGIPFSDCILVRHRTIVEEKGESVDIVESSEIQFTKSASLQKIVRSSTEKEIRKTGNLVREYIETFIKAYKRERQVLWQDSKSDEGPVHREIQVEEEQAPQSSSVLLEERYANKVSQLKTENQRRMLLVSGIFLLILLLSRVV